MCIYVALQQTTADFEEKQQARSVAEKVMFSLIRDIEELKRLNEKGRKLRTEMLTALDVLHKPESIEREHNLRRKLDFIRTSMRDFIQWMYRYKRTPATLMFVFMISSSLRDRKPYAIPIQCLPYASLKESDMRRLVNNIITEMVNLGMTVAGTCMHVYTMYLYL